MPRATIKSSTSSVSRFPCSIAVHPASTAAFAPSGPCACTSVRLPSDLAASHAARICSPALVDLRDPFLARVHRAEDEANDILDAFLSEGERPLITAPSPPAAHAGPVVYRLAQLTSHRIFSQDATSLTALKP